MKRCLLDTSTFIDLQRARKHPQESWALNTLRNVATYLDTHSRLAICTLSAMEIARGLAPPPMVQVFVDEVLPTLDVLPFDVSSAIVAGEIYQKLQAGGQSIGIVDTQIAGVAISNELVLVTANTKHFERLNDFDFPLELLDWRTSIDW